MFGLNISKPVIIKFASNIEYNNEYEKLLINIINDINNNFDNNFLDLYLLGEYDIWKLIPLDDILEKNLIIFTKSDKLSLYITDIIYQSYEFNIKIINNKLLKNKKKIEIKNIFIDHAIDLVKEYCNYYFNGNELGIEIQILCNNCKLYQERYDDNLCYDCSISNDNYDY